MKINKKLIALSIASTLVLPMVGCNASIKVDDKEIFSYGKDKPQVEEFNKFGKQTTHTDEEAVNAIISGEYTIKYNNQEFTVPMVDVINTLFPNCEISTMAKDENTWLVKFQSGDNYIVYRLSFLTGTLVEQELHYNGVTFKETNDEAHRATLGLIVTEIIEKNNVTDDNKPTEEKKTEKKETDDNKSKEQEKEPTDFDDREVQKNTCKCKRCGKKYDPKTSNSWENEKFCSKECQVNYEQEQEAIAKNKEKEEARQNSKYHCAVCDKPYFPNESGALDPYSFCCPECENHYNQDPNDTASNDYIDHSACKNCGKEIGLNGYMGYCYDCGEALGIGR